MKQYRLLRNNNESGPYSAAQLIELGLKKYDLVWLDGRSAAWRYPCEIDEFKAYAPAVDEQPFDRFFKRPGAAAKAQVATVDTQTATPKPVGAKPRIRIKADWRQVEQPPTETRQAVASPQAQSQPKEPATANTPWQNALVDWQQEQKTTDQASKKSGTNSMTYVPAQTNEPVIETKFSESLDSLKQRYADTILRKKGKPSRSYNAKGWATVILLAIPVLGFCIWLVGPNLHNDSDANTKKIPVAAAHIIPVATANDSPQQSATDNTGQVGVAGNTANSQLEIPKAKKPGKELIPDFDDNADKQPVKRAIRKPVAAVQAQPTAFDKKASPAQQAAALAYPKQQNTVAPPQQYNFTPPVHNNPAARSKVINPTITVNQTNTPAANNNGSVSQTRQQQMAQQYAVAPKTAMEAPTAVFSHVSRQQKIEDFVSVEPDQPAGQTIQNLSLNVENVTDAMIDLVVIDVQYYDAAGRFKTGQTIYVKRIPENETLKVKIPDNAYASRIKFRVSLVSVEKKGVYLVAE